MDDVGINGTGMTAPVGRTTDVHGMLGMVTTGKAVVGHEAIVTWSIGSQPLQKTRLHPQCRLTLRTLQTMRWSYPTQKEIEVQIRQACVSRATHSCCLKEMRMSYAHLLLVKR